MTRLRKRVVAGTLALGALLAPAGASAQDRCPSRVDVERSGTGDLTVWGLFDGYEGALGGQRGAVVAPQEDSLPVGGIFTVPEGLTLTYSVGGIRHVVSGGGRWGLYCLHVARPGERGRTPTTVTQIWGGAVELRGPETAYRHAYVTTPEGRVAMQRSGRVRYRVARETDGATRTVAHVFRGGGEVFVTATTGLAQRSPCRQGEDVAISRRGRVTET